MVGREGNGRFKKGEWKGGPGRPKRTIEERYLAILSDECDPDDWRKICATTVSRAKAGDNVCRQWISDYLLGKPLQRQEITGAEGGALVVNIHTNVDADAV